jgi:hypothetical protein
MFMFTRCGICCVLAIFEHRHGRLGSKISGYVKAFGRRPHARGTTFMGRHPKTFTNSDIARRSQQFAFVQGADIGRVRRLRSTCERELSKSGADILLVVHYSAVADMTSICS